MKNKGVTINPPGLLKPIDILNHRRKEILMDFIAGSQNSEGKDAIFVVTDKLINLHYFVEFKVHILQAKWWKCS